MALEFNLTDIADRKTVCWGTDGYMRPVTESIIFATMSTDIGRITVDNAADFFQRYQAFNAVFGFDDFFTFADVAAHVGLSTNVNTTDHETWTRDRYAGFVARKADDDRRQAAYKASQTGTDKSNSAE